MNIEYLAGLFDGEGSFSIQANLRWLNRVDGSRTRGIIFNPRMTMSLKVGHGNTVKAMNLMVSELGGKIYHYDKDDMMRWNLGTLNLLKEVVPRIRPYLIIKQDIADRFLETVNKFPGRQYTATSNRQKVWSVELCREVAMVAYTLNPHQRFKRSLDDLIKEIDEIYGIPAA